MTRKIICSMWAALMVLLVSCTGDSYLNVVPRGSKALMSIRLAELAVGQSGEGTMQLPTDILGLSDLGQSGIDALSPLYLFESPDGFFGLAAHVESQKSMESWLEGQTAKGTCQRLSERRGRNYFLLNDSWMLTHGDGKLLVMGPVVPTQQAALAQTMARLMEQEAKHGIADSPIYNKLCELESPLSVVAQTAVLPDMLASAFAIGAPKGTDESQVLVAAELEVEANTLVIRGETFSFSQKIQAGIEQNLSAFHPLAGRFLQSVPAASVAWLTHAKGVDLLQLMQQNKMLQTLLNGANAAIDMNTVVSHIDGDVMVCAGNLAASTPTMAMGAQMDGTDMQQEIASWQNSCQPGASIRPVESAASGLRAYRYESGKNQLYFATATPPTKEFFVGNDASCFDMANGKSPSALTPAQAQLLKDQRCALVLPLESIGDGDAAQLVRSLLQPLFGQVETIIYIMK